MSAFIVRYLVAVAHLWLIRNITSMIEKSIFFERNVPLYLLKIATNFFVDLKSENVLQ